MKTAFFLLLLSVLVSCTSQKTVVETRIEKDTIYKSAIQYDSVYIERNTDIDRTRDTILIREQVTKTKYKIVHDSIYLSKHDSIPYAVTITKRENIPRSWLDIAAYISLIIVTAFLAIKVRNIIYK